MSSIKKQITRSLARHGWLGTARLGTAAAWRLFRETVFGPSAQARAQAASDAEFDRHYGVDTGGIIAVRDLDANSANWKYSTRYQPIYRVDFGQVLGGLGLDYERTLFIDLGAGKGRAVLLASALPFRKILGVEFSPTLARIAQDNVARYRADDRRCWDIEIVCGDAADYELPPEPTVLYLYNPFERQVMVRIVENVRRSLVASPRRFVVLYFNPVDADLWSDVAGLIPVATAADYRIYHANPE
jgi:SAM-dependent methyltransferase